jgi:hypothetical protein
MMPVSAMSITLRRGWWRRSNRFEVSKDGRRFLLPVPAEQADSGSMNVVELARDAEEEMTPEPRREATKSLR